MKKKDLVLYIVILLLVVLSLWQWISKGVELKNANLLEQQNGKLEELNSQLQLLAGIGPLGSAHLHADTKVYINGQAIDFSQSKYQLTTRYIHFEEHVGDVIHTHATGLTVGHMLESANIRVKGNCLIFEGAAYCDDSQRKLKFYINGKPNNEFEKHVIEDMDKILISYGDENEPELASQLSSVTNLAAQYSKGKSS